MSKVTAAAAEVSTPPGLLCQVSEGADPASPARRERGTDNERERDRDGKRDKGRGGREGWGPGCGVRDGRRERDVESEESKRQRKREAEAEREPERSGQTATPREERS